MVSITVQLPYGKSTCLELSNEVQVRDLKRLSVKNDLVAACCYVVCDGHRLSDTDTIENGHIYHIIPRLLGGKGGFGSMLRAIGAQIEKTTNREACRDLSGRRMRDLNNEQKLRDWVARQAEREREKEEKRKARMERRRAAPKHNFHDPHYSAQMSSTAEDIRDAVRVGLQKTATASQPSTSAGHSRKRKARDVPDFDVKKVASEWLGMDLDLTQLSSDSDSDSDNVSCPESSETPPSSSQSENSSKLLSHVNPSDTVTQPVGATNESRAASQPSNDSPPKIESQSVDEKPACMNTAMEPMETDPPTGNSEEKTLPLKSPVAQSTSDKPCGLLSALADHPPWQEGGNKEDKQPAATVDLDLISSAAELEDLGLDALKVALQSRGLKCSGTLQDRAQRLWAIKGLTPEQIPASFFPKPAKGKKK